MLLFAVSTYGQSGSNRYTAGINYTVGVPTFVPNGNVSKVAIDTGTMKWYEYSQVGGWRWSGDRVQDISGCSAPAYTPGKAQSRIVLNSCTAAQNGHGPEMYKYTGTEWLCLNCVTGGGGVYTGGEGIVVDSPSIRIDTLDRLSFATSPTLPGGVGTVRWNDTDGTLEFGMKGGNVTQQIGQEQLILVKHADNSGLANGNVVYVVGSDGANKTVRLARADAESTSANTFGVMTEAATGGNKAFCTTFGLVRDLNTSALTEGAMVWLSSATAGAMTTTRPAAPNHAVQIGFCIRSHATQGVIFVSVQNGYELDELHNVTISSPSNGQILQYNSAGSQWVNATLSALTGTGAANRVAFFTDASTLSYSNNFTWKADVSYLGIGNTAPQTPVHITGSGSGGAGRVWVRAQTTNSNSGAGFQMVNSAGRFASFQYTSPSYSIGEGMSVFTESDFPILFYTYGAISSGGIAPIIFSAGGYANEAMRVTGAKIVSIGTTTPSASAKLDVTSTTQGVLFPRMTATQRDAIASPPDGLVVYNTTAAKLQVRAASAWVDLH